MAIVGSAVMSFKYVFQYSLKKSIIIYLIQENFQITFYLREPVISFLLISITKM